MLENNIILTGFMGTGKTVTGQEVAARVGRPFVDLDDIIVERAGKPIPAIFAEDGEPAFRALEAAICQELSAPAGLVIAVGGGAVVNAANRDALSRGGTLICLDASPETLLRRIGDDDNRPMLAGADRLARIYGLLAQRAEAYAAIADHLDTNHLSVAATAERVTGDRGGLAGGRTAAGWCACQRVEEWGNGGMGEYLPLSHSPAQPLTTCSSRRASCPRPADASRTQASSRAVAR